MRKLCLTLFLALSTSAFAQNNAVVRWRQIIGVITAPGIDNPVATGANPIHSGAGPWTARGGSAHINLATGEGSFDVEGLVLNGGNASGTPGAVKSIVGTLVCNPGASTQVILDTPATNLSSQGDADLTFRLAVPSGCGSPLFLIRVPPSGRWIATGAMTGAGDSSGY